MLDDDLFWERLKGIWTDEWRADAICDGVELDVFDNTDRVEEAKSYCRRCPVRLECLDDALYYRDEGLVRGGLSPAEQTALVRHRARYAHYLKYDVQEVLGML